MEEENLTQNNRVPSPEPPSDASDITTNGSQLRHRERRTSSSQRRLAKYGSTHEPPKDDAVFYPQDDKHSFFAKGRDIESVYTTHKYTEEEKKTLATFESMDYLPSHSEVYKHWLRRQPKRQDWDRWIMMGLIGFSVGFLGFLLHQLIDLVSETKWEKARDFVADDKMLEAWGWCLGYSLIFVVAGSASVVFLRPSAGGSGIPELIGFLNGAVVRHIFNVKTLVIKFFSAMCVVGAGMPVGPEGPMIHLGSLVGAGLSQFKSDTLKVRLPFFERFRNSEDRRNFISAGAAAGVASAFGAPVGGLLFSMEEVSSFWNMRLSWQIFFCSMVSTFTTDLFNSAFKGFKYQGKFGLFRSDQYILFQVTEGLDVNLLAFIPAAILGVIGGILGAMFTFINLKIARGRKRLLSNIKNQGLQKCVRLLEPNIIMIIFATVSVFLPAAFSCTKISCVPGGSPEDRPYCVDMDASNPLQMYNCPKGISFTEGNTTWTNKSFNEIATLLFVSGERGIHHLFSRNTHLEFGYASLFTVLPIYFLMACWAAGTSISSGLVVPMLYIGGLYGRIVGRGMVDLFGVHTSDAGYWSWMDPGAFALIGAASFFGGVSRLTMSLTVIMMEITNDIQFLLPIMVGIMVAKWVGDFVTHPLYHALLELKCIPFLNTEPVVVHEGRDVLNLDLYGAKDVMTPDPVVLHVHEPVQKIARYLLDTTYGGFPVVKKAKNGELVFHGLITRLELTVLLMHEEAFDPPPEDEDVVEQEVTCVDYEALTLDKLSDPARTQERLQQYLDEDRYARLYVNLHPYTNQSAVSIRACFSLNRTYIIFRTLGLRHMTVIDEQNHVMGIITRKDLMGFSLEERLSTVIEQERARERGAEVEMTLTVA
ncbi:chloride channel protein C [Lingula anatina]|uniref:Chloride channel protein n=1 Tax=Lingula anatina TaxID=7574 RepID=A0A1S3J260_LINAN|nr:chloride channel protein C [Lingula anatina]|eukprot:XP_013403924.1 chloride channel protein C [Lingula anatina]